ncbi:EF-hand domain-containing protein [Roseibium aggregatum]|uniref:EF-hand domain-containing protein n=1 Tax=Roseibium aggregatum TaxID=187304 RepID=A0A926NW67_9HYPH|nr:EF-hand domain-containing protein [Roseibium aggregatum]MBD1545491.1 EF-hand domain-containing protein [Roseibium aggregatum]
MNPTKTEISAFMKADTNKDRVLTREEFRTFIQAMASSGSKTAKKIRFLRAYSYAFSIADANRDGVATPHEMRAADNAHGVGSK